MADGRKKLTERLTQREREGGLLEKESEEKECETRKQGFRGGARIERSQGSTRVHARVHVYACK